MDLAPATAQAAAAAAAALRGARALLVTAGAGMGVDSGLPDFRGPQGFWRAYPRYERLGLSFQEAANPVHFDGDPAFGWGFYGHRLRLYRDTVPHAGFGLLRDFVARFGLDHFVVTSNVDGQFQKAGFAPDRVCEIHGSIHHLQCVRPCRPDVWENREEIPVDEATMRAGHVPRCPGCGGVARPNILMFDDYRWVEERSNAQGERLDAFLAAHVTDPLVVVEMGAGTALPSIRSIGEQVAYRPGCLVVRINPREPAITRPHLALPVGALEGLRAIAAALDAP
jgi:NAD-dependent SIR2 family protein deacetylase